MAKKINNSVTALGFKVGKSAPIDDRTQFLTRDDLIIYTLTGGLVSLYDGLEVFIEETGFKYKWVEIEYGLLNPYNGQVDPLYHESFEYPEYAVGGVIYTGRRFNWVISSTAVTYNLTVVADAFTGGGPIATSTGIHIRYKDLPRNVADNAIVNAAIRVLGAVEIDLPGGTTWELGEYVTLDCIPMYQLGTELIVKIV